MIRRWSLNANQVKTQKDFCGFVRVLAKEASTTDRSLEEYLRALWLLVQEHKDAQVSFSLLAQMLAEALTAPVVSFDEDWLSYESPPEELGQDWPVEDDYHFLQKMLLYQIADLHRMREEGVFKKPPHILWLGVSRTGGKTWYNLTPTSYLDCAPGGLRADSEHTECDWSNLAILLWLGQIYE